ncbi:hypothetical protein phiPsal1_046 [Pontimonas phage phiPsal1]|nr:hypothetical protein phiPsal1_046 [Pontimonas phage phiPsal1]
MVAPTCVVVYSSNYQPRRNQMTTNKIVGRATVLDVFGNEVERGFSFDGMEGFTRFLNSYIGEIVKIDFIK